MANHDIISSSIVLSPMTASGENISNEISADTTTNINEIRQGKKSKRKRRLAEADSLGEGTQEDLLAQSHFQAKISHFDNGEKMCSNPNISSSGNKLRGRGIKKPLNYFSAEEDWQNDSALELKGEIELDMDSLQDGDGSNSRDEIGEIVLALRSQQNDSYHYKTLSNSNSNTTEDEEEVDGDVDDHHPRILGDELDLDVDDTISHKTFKERAIELMKKTQGENSHFVHRTLNSDDWLYIHRIIRKSKGLKSKFMMKNLAPYLFDPAHVTSWKCQHCNDMISSPVKNYMEHMTVAHGIGDDDDSLFPCDVCGVYVKKDKYVVHWVPHFMEHACPICKKTFALNCHMKYHYKVVHEEGEQTCLQCGKLMKNDLAMRRHLRLFHSNKTNWKVCDICGKCVKSRCLEPHKLTHSQERPYRCDVCKKCFKTPSTLYQHQKVHATDSKAHKYLCEYCGKRFKHHTSWNLHVVRIHEGEYEHECPVCHKRFHKLFELKKHSVKHSEERPFPCSICLKCFKTKTHLKEHITIHSEEKSHICPLCGKGIRMKANLYKHLKVHRNRGEYVPPLNSSSNGTYGSLLTPTATTNTNSNSTLASNVTTAVTPLVQVQPQKDQYQNVSTTISSSVPVEVIDLESSQDEDHNSAEKPLTTSSISSSLSSSLTALENFDLIMSSVASAANEAQSTQQQQQQMLVVETDHDHHNNHNHHDLDLSSSIIPISLNLNIVPPDHHHSSPLHLSMSTNNSNTGLKIKQIMDSQSFDGLIINTNNNDGNNLFHHHHHHNHNLNSGTNSNTITTTDTIPNNLLQIIAAAALNGTSLTHLTIMVNNNHNYNQVVNSNHTNNNGMTQSNTPNASMITHCINAGSNNNNNNNNNTSVSHVEPQSNSDIILPSNDGGQVNSLHLNINPIVNVTYHPNSC